MPLRIEWFLASADDDPEDCHRLIKQRRLGHHKIAAARLDREIAFRFELAQALAEAACHADAEALHHRVLPDAVMQCIVGVEHREVADLSIERAAEHQGQVFGDLRIDIEAEIDHGPVLFPAAAVGEIGNRRGR